MTDASPLPLAWANGLVPGVAADVATSVDAVRLMTSGLRQSVTDRPVMPTGGEGP